MWGSRQRRWHIFEGTPSSLLNNSKPQRVCQKREREKERETEFLNAKLEREVPSSMVSRERKKAAVLQEKLQLLRSITNSQALHTASIILDASKYIEELKQKIERLNQDISQTSSHQNSIPAVTVETLERGFLIKASSMKSGEGLLVFILEAFESLGLNVVEARVSCTDSFRLRAVAENDGQREAMDAQSVKEAVVQAMKDWSNSSERG